MQIGDQRIRLGNSGLPVEIAHLRLGIARQETLGIAIGINLHHKVSLGVLDHLVTIGHAHQTMCLEQILDMRRLDHPVFEKAIFRHHRLWHNRLRVAQVIDMPVIRIAPADTGQIRPRPLGPPLERVVIFRFRRQRIVPIALDLIAHRADHLSMADVTALADVDIAARQLQRRVGAHALYILDGVFKPEQRGDLHDPPNRDDKEGKDRQKRDVLFQDCVFVQNCHLSGPPYSAGTALFTGATAGERVTVIQRL